MRKQMEQLFLKIMRRHSNMRVWVILSSLWLLFIGVLFILSNMQQEVVDAAAFDLQPA